MGVGTVSLQPVLIRPALDGFSPVDPDNANELCVRWGHELGPCKRPFGLQAFTFDIDGEPVSVAISASTVSAEVGGTLAPVRYARTEVVRARPALLRELLGQSPDAALVARGRGEALAVLAGEGGRQLLGPWQERQPLPLRRLGIGRRRSRVVGRRHMVGFAPERRQRQEAMALAVPGVMDWPVSGR